MSGRKEGRERMESWVIRLVAKILPLRLRIRCAESYDKLFLYQKGTFVPPFFVASFYWHKKTCANTSILSALRKIIRSDQIVLTCKYLKQQVSRFPDIRKGEMRERRREGGREWEALLLRPLCPRWNEHLIWGQRNWQPGHLLESEGWGISASPFPPWPESGCPNRKTALFFFFTSFYYERTKNKIL